MEDPNALSFECDWRAGFNMRADQKPTVGYLLFLAGCGGLNLTKDIKVYNPFSGPGQTVVSGETVSCIGLIERLDFGGGDSDPIRISAYVSRDSAANVRAKVGAPLSSTKLKLGWYIIDYDDDRKAWYEAAFIKNATSAQVNLDSLDGELQLYADRTATRLSETLAINVYKMVIQVVPTPGVTAELEFASGPTTRFVRQWGTTES